MKTIILFVLLFITINCGRTVYMCHDDPFKDEQCMKTETLGKNTFVWVRKCKGAKVCVNLPYYGEIICACSIKVRPHYDGESCANGNKCASGICDGTKCKGLNPNIQCVPGLGQCKKGYLCRATKNSLDTYEAALAAAATDPSIEVPDKVFQCQKPLAENDECKGYSKDISTVGDYYLYDKSVLFNPASNPCKLNYICSSVGSDTPKCIKIGEQNDGTVVSNPMACKSGVGTKSPDVYTCITPTSSTTSLSDEDLTTSRGATFTNFVNVTKMFSDWKSEVKDSLDDEDAIYEAYRYTSNKKKINKLFFQYTQAAFVEDADECAFDYLWKQSSSNSLKFSLMILVLALLF